MVMTAICNDLMSLISTGNAFNYSFVLITQKLDAIYTLFAINKYTVKIYLNAEENYKLFKYFLVNR